MALVQKTLYMAVNKGYLITLPLSASNVKVTSTVACEVTVYPPTLAGGTAPIAPVATQLPAADGVITDFYRLAANGSETFGYEFPKGGNAEYGDAIGYVAVWCEAAAGTLTIKAH